VAGALYSIPWGFGDRQAVAHRGVGPVGEPREKGGLALAQRQVVGQQLGELGRVGVSLIEGVALDGPIHHEEQDPVVGGDLGSCRRGGLLAEYDHPPHDRDQDRGDDHEVAEGAPAFFGLALSLLSLFMAALYCGARTRSSSTPRWRSARHTRCTGARYSWSRRTLPPYRGGTYISWAVSRCEIIVNQLCFRLLNYKKDK